MRTVGEETTERYENAVPGTYVLLEVADTGRGMDRQTRERIMEPFFTTKKDREGTGLGLSTVYGIVKQLDGFLTVTSTINRGSTFTVFIPESKKKRAEKQRESTVADTGEETILLVEDEEELRNVAGRMLESKGYTVLVAADGHEALDVLRERPGIDLVITDVVMPGMNGRELAEEIDKSYPGKVILFISGYTDDSVIQHGVSERRINFLHKPFSKTELHRKVRELLDDQSSEG
jgi:CheY-like chemotaxis protein